MVRPRPCPLIAVVVALALVACGGRAGKGKADGGSCSASAFLECQYPVGAAGEPQRQTLMVTDPTTGRVLPVLARLPPGAGPFPVVVWSHGGGLDDNGQNLSPEWALTFAHHGFAVLNIGHVGLTQATGAAVCAAGSIPPAECIAPMDDESGMLTFIKVLDVQGVLDALPQLETQLGGALDLERVAVAGWSAGARGPLSMFGTRFLPSVSSPVFSTQHARPKAIVALSPMGPGWAGYFDMPSGNSWEQSKGPVLVITGNNDLKPTKPGLTGATRRTAYERMPADGARWLLYSNLPEGVGEHGTYNLGDLDSTDARLSRLSLAILSAALAHLDAQLSKDATAAAWLAGDDAKTLAGDADWQHK